MKYLSYISLKLKKYLVLIRAYSLVDVFFVFLLAKILSGARVFSFVDIYKSFSLFFLWGFLTLSLEAKHRHKYREIVPCFVPYVLLILASIISLFFNFQALLLIFFIWLFCFLYTQKETSVFCGSTSFLWRGLYQTTLFVFFLTLYCDIRNISLFEIIIGIVLFFFYASRNLIADIRDVIFDKNTFTVRFGVRLSYIISLFFYLIGIWLLYLLFVNLMVIFPALVMSIVIIFYDDGFNLHRCSIIVTTFTLANIISMFTNSNLLLLNILFLSVLSNLLFYEKIARLSNPWPRVQSRISFLFKR